MSVLPVPAGNTVQPSARAPSSRMKPPGVMWCEKALWTMSPAANAGGEEGARRLPRVDAWTLRLPQRPGRQEYARAAKQRGIGEAAEGRLLGLRVHQVGFAQHRQFCQRGAACHASQIDAVEPARQPGRGGNCLGQEVRQSSRRDRPRGRRPRGFQVRRNERSSSAPRAAHQVATVLPARAVVAAPEQAVRTAGSARTAGRPNWCSSAGWSKSAGS